MKIKNKNAYESAQDFEVTKSYMQDKALALAYRIITILSICFALSLLILFFLFPLKREVPYVIKVDGNGKTEIVTVLGEEKWTLNEALDKSNIHKYVRLREGYVWETVNYDFKLLQIFSAPSQIQSIINSFQGEDGKATVLVNKIKIEPKIISIVLGRGGGGLGVATVRAELNYVNTQSNAVIKKDKVTITLSYMYNTKLEMLEKYRVENPLGFTVVSYQIDREIN